MPLGTLSCLDVSSFPGVAGTILVARENIEARVTAEIEMAFKKAVAIVLGIDVEKVVLSIPVEKDRDTDWGKNPYVRCDFADLDDLSVKKMELALHAGCQAIFDIFPENSIESVRGRLDSFDQITQYVKVTAKSNDSNTINELIELMKELFKVRREWDNTSDPPMLNGLEIGLKHENTLIYQNGTEYYRSVDMFKDGNFHITLIDGSVEHKLTIWQFSNDSENAVVCEGSPFFPFSFFTTWLKNAIEACK